MGRLGLEWLDCVDLVVVDLGDWVVANGSMNSKTTIWETVGMPYVALDFLGVSFTNKILGGLMIARLLVKTFLDFARIHLVVIELCSLILKQIVGVVHILVCSTLSLVSNHVWFVFALKIIRNVILNSRNC